MTTRNGKIARLPHYIREQLNERLDQNEESTEILPWLNGLDDVKQALQKYFGGAPVSKQNLSEWRQGGFLEWLEFRHLYRDAADLGDFSDDLAECDRGGLPADNVATFLAARIGSLLLRWNGEVDDAFLAKARVLNQLCRSVTQLQRGMQRARREALECNRLEAEQEQAEREVLKKRFTAPLYNAIREESMAKIFGGGQAGLKIARFILAVESDNLDARINLLPTDKFDVPDEETTVKPNGKTTTKRPARKISRKTTRPKQAKPLRENKLDSEEEKTAEPAPSDCVQVDQTSSEPAISSELEAAAAKLAGQAEARQIPPGSPEPDAPFCLPEGPN